MRICFDNIDLKSNSGPNSFAGRLSNKLTKMGYEIVSPFDVHDVFLSFIQQSHSSYPFAQKILRLDGIWFKPENFEENNKPIKDAYYSFDHIIFQSEFDKQMIESHFGKRADCSVIHNGIELIKYDKIPELKHVRELIFVCSSSWHPQKRLKDNILLFQHIRRQLKKEEKEARLYILGSGSSFPILDSEYLENVFYLGQQSHEACLRFYATADYFMHLAWLDHCPNVVVEALSQGCPVICTNSGGTKEIVKNNGIILQEIKEYNFELCDYDNPPDLDFSNFVLPEERPKVDPSHLSIEKIAEEYIKVFNE